MLDGLVAANSLHFVARDRQVEAIRGLAAHLRPGGAFVVVEYDADRGNPGCRTRSAPASWDAAGHRGRAGRRADDRPRPEPVPRGDLRGGRAPGLTPRGVRPRRAARPARAPSRPSQAPSPRSAVIDRSTRQDYSRIWRCTWISSPSRTPRLHHSCRPSPAPPPTPAAPAAPATRPSGIRRAVLTAGVSALLLVGGAAAIVNAASPSVPRRRRARRRTRRPRRAPPTPSARPPAGTGHSSKDCPNMGGSGGTSGGSSGGSPHPAPATPATPAPTPAT